MKKNNNIQKVIGVCLLCLVSIVGISCTTATNKDNKVPLKSEKDDFSLNYKMLGTGTFENVQAATEAINKAPDGNYKVSVFIENTRDLTPLNNVLNNSNKKIDLELKRKDSNKTINILNMSTKPLFGDWLVGVTLSDGFKIGNNAFKNCKELEVVKLPSDLKSISNYAFDGCSKLKKINIPNTIETIGASAFANCTSLSFITLPKNEKFTKIDGYTFMKCSNLEEIKIPSTVKTISLQAFDSCSKLKTVVIPKNVTKILGNAFNNCSTIELKFENDSEKWLICSEKYVADSLNPYGGKYENQKIGEFTPKNQKIDRAFLDGKISTSMASNITNGSCIWEKETVK